MLCLYTEIALLRYSYLEYAILYHNMQYLI